MSENKFKSEGCITGRWAQTAFFEEHRVNKPKSAEFENLKRILEPHAFANTFMSLPFDEIEARVVAHLTPEEQDACRTNSAPTTSTRRSKKAYVPVYGPENASGKRRVVGTREVPE